MRIKKSYIFIALVIIPVIVLSQACIAKSGITTLAKLGVSEEDYCYDTKMGMSLYKGIPNKRCLCAGEEIVTFPDTDARGNRVINTNCPDGLVCDSSTVYCKGEITGYRFSYNNLQFGELKDWEEYCKTLTSPDDCMRNLNYTQQRIAIQDKD